MSRLTDLLAQVKKKDSQLGDDLDREFKVLASRRSFGLNFERHRPEAVELPQRPIRDWSGGKCEQTKNKNFFHS